jgi:hypothetical protein
MHTPHSTQVAGCIEYGNSRMVDHDLAFKLRALIDCSWQNLILVIKSIEILAKGEGKLLLQDECSKCLRVLWIAIF